MMRLAGIPHWGDSQSLDHCRPDSGFDAAVCPHGTAAYSAGSRVSLS